MENSELYEIVDATVEHAADIGFFEYSNTQEVEPDLGFQRELADGLARMVISEEGTHYYYLKQKSNDKLITGGGMTEAYCFEEKGKTCCFQAFYVVPDERRKGYMKKIYNILENEAKSLGNKVIFLNCYEENIPAMNLYSNLGFKKEFITLGNQVFASALNLEDLRTRKAAFIENIKTKLHPKLEDSDNFTAIENGDQKWRTIHKEAEILDFTNLHKSSMVVDESHFEEYFKFIDDNKGRLGETLELVWILNTQKQPVGFFTVIHNIHFAFGIPPMCINNVFINNEMIEQADEIYRFAIKTGYKIFFKNDSTMLAANVSFEEGDQRCGPILKEFGYSSNPYPTWVKKLVE